MSPVPDILPIFRFCQGESWFPIGVEESLKPLGYTWQTPGWRNNNKMVPQINLPPRITQPDLPPVVYHRVATGGGLAWHQYWLWYLYNPWGIGGVGKHEGGWEFVQIGRTPGERARPILMTCSQHHNGGSREYWSVELKEDRPVVYVAWAHTPIILPPVGKAAESICVTATARNWPITSCATSASGRPGRVDGGIRPAKESHRNRPAVKPFAGSNPIFITQTQSKGY